MVGGDFFELANLSAPKGLVSDPPNYGACVADLERLTARRTASERKVKCEQLYAGIKQQALAYLIVSNQEIGEDAEHGLAVTNAEVEKQFKRERPEKFPTEADLRRYLQQRGWTLSDELNLIKRDILANKLVAALRREFPDQHALIEALAQTTKKWTAKTTCNVGYIVPGCKQYKGASSSPAPAVVIEEVMRPH